MKIVLFGKNGQLGKELDIQARALGFEIISFGREDADITDVETVQKIIKQEKPDFVINASAYHVVSECESFPDKAFAINALAVKHLAETCDKVGSKLVHFSTDYIFDGAVEKPFTEDAKPNPLQAYGISKLAGEYFALNYSPVSVIIRTCGVYGGATGSRSKKGNFVLSILKQADGKKEMEISSEQIVIPTYAVDLAKATLELLQKETVSGVYHLVNEGYCSWADFAQYFLKEYGSKTKIIPVDRGGMVGTLRKPLFSALENSRAKKIDITLPTWQDAVTRYIKSL